MKKIRKTKSIAVHIRFFDIKNINGDSRLPADYYQKAIRLMEKKFPGSHYFIFSDFPNLAKNLIRITNDRVTFVKNNINEDLSYLDLWLMSSCQNFVLAYSTFSWWGAWLSDRKEKFVICPSLNKTTDQNTNTSLSFPKEWHKQC